MERETAWYKYFSNEVPNFVLRCFLMIAGITCIAAGVALAKLSATGTSSISCIPAVTSDIFVMIGHPEITLGIMTFTFNVLLIMIEIALLRRKFHPIQLLQLPVLFIFSWAIDQWMALFSIIPLPNYFARFVMLVASMIVLGFGVFIEVKGNVLMLPGEAVVYTISHVSRVPFHRCKVMFDTTMIASAALISIIAMHGLFDVREGSILSALLVGNFVKMWSNIFHGLDSVVPPAAKTFIAPIIPALNYGKPTKNDK